jgi:deoxyribonuclease II
VSSALQCKDDTGRDVDWWVAVKAPRGTDYFYGDATSDGAFTASPHSMNDTSVGALGSTLRQIWTPTTSVAYILWNDDPPMSEYYNFSYGHTKGALVLDTTADGGGFWLTHSVPKFPAGPAQEPAGYTGLGSNAWMYGQSAACFSLTPAASGPLAETLQFNHPHIYETGGDFSAFPSAVGDLANGAWRADPICQQTAVQVGGLAATVFAKTPAWNADLWSACVSPALRSDLWVESWLRGSEEGPICQGDWQTLDVQDLAWGSVSWESYNDHSKWASAVNPSLVKPGRTNMPSNELEAWNTTSPTLCIGDINRMTTQYERAGGAVCFSDPIATAFQAAVTQTDSC